MLIAAVALVISLGLLGYFARRYRRALVAVSSTALPADFVRAAGISVPKADTNAFRVVLSLEEMCPALDGNGRGLRAVRVYARLLHAVRRASARLWPAVSQWAERERELCFRYAVVRLSERAGRNRDAFADIRAV